MANRYWVGISGDWHDGNNWALTSGGGGGAGVPTAVDDVFFDANGANFVMFAPAFVCNNYTLEATAGSKFIIFNQGGVINGNFTMHAGYFAGSGGGGYVLEFKGNYYNTGGTFAMGTGTGVDITCLFSGGSNTYVHDNTTSAQFQNFSVSGVYVFSGTRMTVANVVQTLSAIGTIDIASGNRIDLSGTFGVFTGKIQGVGRFMYLYTSTSSIPATGIISCAFFQYYVSSPIIEIDAREYASTCKVELKWNTTGQSLRLKSGIHHFMNGVDLLCNNAAVTSAELDMAQYNAEIYSAGNFRTLTNEFPNAIFNIKWGDGSHVFRLSVSFFFSFTSVTAHFTMDAGAGTIILWSDPVGFGIAQHRLVRVHAAGVDPVTYNRIICYSRPDSTRGATFIENFNVMRLVIEGYRGIWQFRTISAPLILMDIDYLIGIGNDRVAPAIRARLSMTGLLTGFKLNKKSDIYNTNFLRVDASYGNAIEAYNTDSHSYTTNIDFYDRNIRRIGSIDNILSGYSVLNARAIPRPIADKITRRFI